MEHTPFEYGGLHFIPERQFEPAGKHHSLIHVSRLRLDVELGFCKKGYALWKERCYDKKQVKFPDGPRNLTCFSLHKNHSVLLSVIITNVSSLYDGYKSTNIVNANLKL